MLSQPVGLKLEYLFYSKGYRQATSPSFTLGCVASLVYVRGVYGAESGYGSGSVTVQVPTRAVHINTFGLFCVESGSWATWFGDWKFSSLRIAEAMWWHERVVMDS